jgi:hypothetical protein
VLAIAAVDDLRDTGKARQFDDDAQFLLDFAAGRVFGPFAEIDLAAGQAPGAGFGFLQALDQKQAPLIVEDCGAAAGSGAEGESVMMVILGQTARRGSY